MCLYSYLFLPPEPDAKAILSAAEEGNLEKIKKLLSKNRLLLNCTDKDGYTPLHRACYGNNVEVVEVDLFIRNYFLLLVIIKSCKVIFVYRIFVSTVPT